MSNLTITSIDLDGVSSTEVRDFQLFEDRESTHEFQTPHGLPRCISGCRGQSSS